MSRLDQLRSASSAESEQTLDELFLVRLRYSEHNLTEVKRNKPFVLDQPDVSWVVYSGSVDIYAVQIQDGKAIGPRKHLLRVTAGGGLFGMDLAKADTGMLVVGNGNAHLIKVPLARLQQLLAKALEKDAITTLLEGWIVNISKVLITGLPPKNCQLLQSGTDVPFAARATAGPKKQVLWVRPAEGELSFCHLPARPLPLGRTMIPLCKHTWVGSPQDTHLRVLDTSQWLVEDPEWAGLKTFQSLAADVLCANRREADQTESQREQQKTDGRRNTMSSALRSMASILEPGQRLPVFDESELGALLAACRMVGAALGIDIQTPNRTQVERQKRDLLGAIARTSGIRTRPVYLDSGWWTSDHGPLLGYRKQDNRPVVLLPVKAGYELVDPANPPPVTVTPEAAGELKDLGVTFYRSFPEHPIKIGELLRFGLRGLHLELSFLLSMAAASSVMALFIPLATGWLFGQVIPNTDMSLLGFLALGWLCSAVAGTAFQVAGGLAQLRLEGRLQLSLEAALWSRLMALPATFFRRFTAGDLSSRAFSISAIRRTLTGATLASIITGIFSIFSLALLIYYDAGLAMAALGLAMVTLVTTFGITSWQLHNQRAEMDWEGKLGSLVLQILNGIAKLRVAGAEEWAFTLWATRFTQQKKASYNERIASAMLAAYNAAFSNLSTLLFFALLIERVNHMPAATFLAFSAAYGQFQASLLSMGVLFSSTQTIRLLYERTRPILEVVPEVEKNQADPGELSGRVELSRISYRYNEDGPLILNDISMSIEPGSMVAIVGASGSGKSTLFRLLLKFEKPLSGAVYFDGQDLAGLNVDAVRRQVGVVLQNGKLMPGTIYSNIVGAISLPLELAWNAARMAGLGPYIESLPMGMQTIVSEGGSTFSGGQRQRLMIARAIVNRPRILLFDEATSALDSETQAIVTKNLENLQATRIIIAHRLSTIAQADQIFVLDRGNIVQTGTYDALMKTPGPFTELVKRQM
jgi:NHLM bacteriocin system ABC transporter ATP-binding protein